MNDNTEPNAGMAGTGCCGSNPQGCVCGGRGPALSQMMRLMMPSSAAGDHFRNASVEFLKGMRELLDQRIQTMSNQGQPGKGTKLNVD